MLQPLRWSGVPQVCLKMWSASTISLPAWCPILKIKNEKFQMKMAGSLLTSIRGSDPMARLMSWMAWAPVVAAASELLGSWVVQSQRTL